MTYKKDWKFPSSNPMSALNFERNKMIERLEKNNRSLASINNVNSVFRASYTINKQMNIGNNISESFRQVNAINKLYQNFPYDSYKASAHVSALEKLASANSVGESFNNIGKQVQRLSKMDFRIEVVSQKIVTTISERPEQALTNLSSKQNSYSADELPEKVVAVLDEYKQIVREQEAVLYEFYETRNKDINDKNLNSEQKETFFLLNWKWYLEALSTCALSLLFGKMLDQIDPIYVFTVLTHFLQIINK
ncbi:hypothetical protein HCJ02_01965 [Listeria seeligeri]|uniref:Uncharacterized protein n=1 Tax=Listeria immobilis TaxID=2713502 RepID=A0ABR6SUT0_9LIST|nr:MULTISPECIES: hypothetical protein [Listeria]MBC1509441.1 hypothetical protein [Listeria immobilis]MBC1532100.1 hypothetical protein [Listeria seeligeri]MBC1827086.1 hypothetical protein [Listeria seeligeri]MBC1840120.1 hypothetical protein [Listeria seeligeri]MBC6141873.1 hypothetical protein [Listeria seeligeri]